VRFSDVERLTIDSILNGAQYTTAVANVITSTKAYSIFANDKFEKRRYYLRAHSGVKNPLLAEALSLVSDSGRELHDIPLYDGGTVCPNFHRSLNDSHTRCLLLNTKGVATPCRADYVIESTDFHVRACKDESNQLDRDVMVDDLETLAYVGIQYQWAVWQIRSEVLKMRIHVAMTLELLKMPVDKRPLMTYADGNLDPDLRH
jgi:hypothetical protein